MIHYVEKGYGLHEAIQAAGHWLSQLDGVWVADDEKAVQAIIDAYADPLPDLTRAQFSFLLALSGFEDIWAGLEHGLKASDPVAYATLRGLRDGDLFNYDRTMALIETYRPMLPASPALTPDQVADVWRFTAASF